MANARYSCNSKGPLLSSEEQPTHQCSSVMSNARPPSPDGEIELALGVDYTLINDEAAYGAKGEIVSPKGTYP